MTNNIDLSKLTNFDGANVASGIASGIDAKSLINSSLKPILNSIEIAEQDGFELSNKAKAMGDFQNALMNIKSAIEMPFGVKSALSHRKSRTTDEFCLEILPKQNAELQTFSISDIKIASNKKVISDPILNLDNPFNLSASKKMYISPVTLINTRIENIEIESNLGSSFFKSNNIAESMKLYNSKDFLGEIEIRDIRIDHLNHDDFIISFWCNDNKYISDNSNDADFITFYCQQNDMKFSCEINPQNCSLEKIQDDFSKLKIVETRVSSNQKQSQYLDRVIFKGVFNDDLYISPFVADENSISVEIDGEIFISKTIDNDSITLRSLNSNNKIVIQLKNQCDFNELQKDANDYFNVNFGVELELQPGKSLYDVVGDINNHGKVIGVSSKILNIGDGEYRLTIESNHPGNKNSFTVVNGPKFLTQSVSRDATFKLNGVCVTKSGNQIEDIIPKVSILLKSDSDKDISVTIERDKTLIKSAIKSFVDIFNELQIFTAKQKETDESGLFLDSAILHGDYLLNNINLIIFDKMLPILRHIGLSINYEKNGSLKYNRLSLNEQALDQSMDLDVVEDAINIMNDISDIISKSTDRASLLNKELGIIKSQSQRNVEKMRFLTEQMNKKRIRLIERYSVLERQIMHVNTIINSLKAQQEAFNSSNR